MSNFFNDLKNLGIPKDHIMVYFHVLGMCPHRLIDLVTQFIHEEWNDIAPHTLVSRNEFENAVCLRSTYFKFDNTTYKQIDGVAMASPLFSVVSNLVIEQTETDCLNKLPFKVFK